MTPTVVLLVDDEVPFVEAISKRLKRRDLSVLKAYDGQEALERLEKEGNIDVVILDVKMPGMDGIATLREIKKIHPLVEVIMLTGHATVESAIEGMKLGAFDYLMKPSSIEVLMAKVQEAKTIKNKHEDKITVARIKEIAMRSDD